MTTELMWKGLRVGDWATWVAAVVTFLTALLAVVLALRDMRRGRNERAARARLVAAYLYVPFTEIRTAAMKIVTHGPRYAAVMSGSASRQVLDDALELRVACDVILPRLKTFRLEDAASLPKNIGEDLASGVMELNLAVESVQSSLELFFGADDHSDPDKERFDAAHGQIRSHLIAEHVVRKIDRFLSYCVEEFDVNTTHEQP